MIPTSGYQRTYYLMAAFVVAAAVFTLFPQIDMTVSGWFYSETHGFWLAGWWIVKLVREVLYLMMALMLLTSLAMVAASFFGLRAWGVPTRIWVFILSLFMFGPLILANSVLKNNWGRARPGSIEEFGGDKAFSPALRWVNECDTNCSFVSGEGSGATALAIAFLVLAPYVLKNVSRRLRRKYMTWALILPGVAIFLRVAMGRHFLSDTVFAILFVLMVAALLYGLIVERYDPKTS